MILPFRAFTRVIVGCCFVNSLSLEVSSIVSTQFAFVFDQ